jgi:hypothetical protein
MRRLVEKFPEGLEGWEEAQKSSDTIQKGRLESGEVPSISVG